MNEPLADNETLCCLEMTALARASQPPTHTIHPPPPTHTLLHAPPPSNIQRQRQQHSGFDCPRYDVLETAGDVQLRRYAAERYAVTTVRGARSLLEAQVVGAKRLLGYFAGENARRERLAPPTLPLETVLFPADPAAETVEGTFCIALFLPRGAQVCVWPGGTVCCWARVGCGCCGVCGSARVKHLPPLNLPSDLFFFLSQQKQQTPGDNTPPPHKHTQSTTRRAPTTAASASRKRARPTGGCCACAPRSSTSAASSSARGASSARCVLLFLSWCLIQGEGQGKGRLGCGHLCDERT